MITSDDKGKLLKWWTFGGLKANASIAAMFATKAGYVPRFDNYSVEIPDSLNIREAEKWFQEVTGRFDEVRADSEPPGRVKF